MIEVLGDQSQVAGLDLLAQTAGSGEGEHLSGAELFQSVNIGPVIDLVGQQLVSGTVAGEKQYLSAPVAAFCYG